MAIQPIADWAPDQPTIASPGELLVNGLPQNTGYYGPARALVDQNADMRDVAATIERVTGVHYWPRTLQVFVGTTDTTAGAKLLAITSPFAATWRDVSQASYGTGQRTFRFADYKNLLVAVYGAATGRVPQVFDAADDIASDNFADLTGAPPADAIMTVRDWMVMLRTFDAADGIVEERIWWSANGDPTDWPVPGTADARQKQSGFADLVGGGRLIAGQPSIGGHDAVIWASSRMWAMNQQPPPTTWRFDPIAKIGALGRDTVAAWSGMAWWLADEGFMEYTGDYPRNIGVGRVNDFFFGDYDSAPASGIPKVIASVDPEESRVCWIYQSINSPNDRPDRQIWYNWRTQKWGHADVAAEFPFIGPLTTSHSRFGIWFVSFLEVTPDDSPAETAFHLAQMAGPTLEFRAEPMESFTENHHRMWIERARPIIPGADLIDVEMRLREFQGTPTYGTGFKPIERDGMVPVRLAARYWRGKVKVPAGQEWSNAIGFEYLTAPYGEMRGGAIPISFRVDSAGNARVDSAGNRRVVR